MCWLRISKCAALKSAYLGEGAKVLSLYPSPAQFSRCKNLTGIRGVRFGRSAPSAQRDICAWEDSKCPTHARPYSTNGSMGVPDAAEPSPACICRPAETDYYLAPSSVVCDRSFPLGSVGLVAWMQRHVRARGKVGKSVCALCADCSYAGQKTGMICRNHPTETEGGGGEAKRSTAPEEGPGLGAKRKRRPCRARGLRDDGLNGGCGC